jgi:hypothetical protein
MSAHAMAVPSGPLPPGRESPSLNPPSEVSSLAEVLRVPAPEPAEFGFEDSARFTDELLRRYEVPYPVPWHHGGINE